MSIASLYPSINPSLLLDFANSKVLDPRITFTRTTTATYYDGVTTAIAEQNLLTYSQEFDNAVWNPQSSSVTSNAVSAPDGTMTADKLVSQSAASIYPRLRRLSALSNRTQTVSVYAKKAEWSYMSINQDGAYIVYYDLNAGTVVSADTATATITSVGNGWFRCTYSYTSTFGGVTQQLVFMAGNTPTYGAQTGDGTSGIYLWGAQLEQRSSATAYTATTTQAITNYIPVLQTASSGQARFDHNPTTGESLGLLIEEARTNSVTYSSEFDNAAWTKTNATITANTIVAPDGTLTGDKLVETTTANSAHQVYKGTTLTAAPYTFSFYAKAAERTWCVVYFDSGFSAAYINLANGTVGSNPSGYAITVTSVGNGWYRIAATRTATAATWYTVIELATADNVRTYTGDGFSGIFIWGAQLEAGSFATSYIPTVASSVTRNADAASMTGTNFSSWFNNGEGTLYGETANYSSGGAAKGIANIGDGSSSRSIGLYYTSSLASTVFEIINGSVQSTFAVAFNSKIAAAYKFNDSNFGYGGSVGTTDTSCTVPQCTEFVIGNVYSLGSFSANGRIKKIAYYPIRVTNAQLQSLTV